MHTEKNSGFSERMIALLRHRTEQRPLPKGYVRCPFNSEHSVPIASIVTHIEKVHNGDNLALIEDSMYSLGTKKRLDAFFECQELNYRSCVNDCSSSSDSSFSSDSSDYSISSESRAKSLDQEGHSGKGKSMGGSRSHFSQQMRNIKDEAVQLSNFQSVRKSPHAHSHSSSEYAHETEQCSRGNNGSIFPAPPSPAGMKRPRSTNESSNTKASLNPTIRPASHTNATFSYPRSVHSHHENKDRYPSLRQQYLYGATDLQSNPKPNFQERTSVFLDMPMQVCSNSCEADISPNVYLNTSLDTACSPFSNPQIRVDERKPGDVCASSEIGTSGLSSLTLQSKQREDMWRSRSIILEDRILKSQINDTMDKDTQTNTTTTVAHGVAVEGHGDDNMRELWRLLYPHMMANILGDTFSSAHSKKSSDPLEGAKGVNKMPITDLLYHSPRVVLIMQNENMKTAFLNSLKVDPVLMAKYEVL